MNSSLSKHSVSGSLGQAHPTFLHPTGRRLSAPTPGEGKKEDPVRTAPVLQPQPQPQPVAAARERHFRQHGSGRAGANQRGPAGRAPPAAAKRGRGHRRCRRAAGHAASVRRRAALQLRQAGLGSLAPSQVGLRLKGTGWRSLGLPLQPPFLTGKNVPWHSSRIFSP